MGKRNTNVRTADMLWKFPTRISEDSQFARDVQRFFEGVKVKNAQQNKENCGNNDCRDISSYLGKL